MRVNIGSEIAENMCWTDNVQSERPRNPGRFGFFKVT